MNYYNIKTLEDAYLYFADCAVANLDFFLFKKNPPKGETERHINICKKIICQGNRFNVDMSKIEERFNDIMNMK